MHDKKFEVSGSEKAMLAEEKRRSPRYTLDVSVKVGILNSVGVASQYFGRGNDISEGGMAIFLAHDLPIGSQIRLTLTLPHSERPITCQACVRSRTSYRYGIEFTDLTAFDREYLTRACHSLSLLQ
jgi:c-di-GMP-binding flagellar brake protein YcgR